MTRPLSDFTAFLYFASDGWKDALKGIYDGDGNTVNVSRDGAIILTKALRAAAECIEGLAPEDADGDENDYWYDFLQTMETIGDDAENSEEA